MTTCGNNGAIRNEEAQHAIRRKHAQFLSFLGHTMKYTKGTKEQKAQKSES